jgi:hypothetical protein
MGCQLVATKICVSRVMDSAIRSHFRCQITRPMDRLASSKSIFMSRNVSYGWFLKVEISRKIWDFSRASVLLPICTAFIRVNIDDQRIISDEEARLRFRVVPKSLSFLIFHFIRARF